MQNQSMKKLFYLCSVIIIGCSYFKKSTDKQTYIDIKTIDHIYVKKDLYGKDSVLLNNKQSKLFVENWNKASSKGFYKVKPEFWIMVRLKNDSLRIFETDKFLIKETNDFAYAILDTTLIHSFWKAAYVFPEPANYNPISFIQEASKTLKTARDTLRIGMTITNNFPDHWVKKKHIDSLILLLDSREDCSCYTNPLSSYIPFNDFAEKGGYAAIFIKSFMENRKVDLGLYSCPKVDKELNMELRKWWKENK